MSFGTDNVFTAIITTFIASFLTYLAARVKTKGDKEATLPEGWKNLTAAMKEHFNEVTNEQERQIKELQDKVNQLMVDVNTLRNKYATATTHIGDLRRGYPEPAEIPPLPDLIRDDIR